MCNPLPPRFYETIIIIKIVNIHIDFTGFLKFSEFEQAGRSSRSTQNENESRRCDCGVTHFTIANKNMHDLHTI